MKRILILGTFFCCNYGFGQVSNHSYFIGGNITGINLDLSSSGISGLTNKDFANTRPGFTIGYRYLLSLSPQFVMGAGLEFKNANTKFSRPYYNLPNFNTNPTSVDESLQFYRIAIPVQVYYSFSSKKDHSVYLTAGTGIILLNSINRTADYQLPAPPTGYVSYTYKGKQTARFNDNSGVGLSIFAGIGYEFTVKGNTFFIEGSFDADASKNKISTLHNIEYDSYYYAKLKSFQLKAGHIFSLKSKKK